jgi:hypothetical protein
MTGVHAAKRLSSLRHLMREKPIVRAMEVHSGLSALIAEKASAQRADGTTAQFDALWSSLNFKMSATIQNSKYTSSSKWVYSDITYDDNFCTMNVISVLVNFVITLRLFLVTTR